MNPDVPDNISDLAEQAIAGVTNSSNNWAAIILLVALLGFLAIAAYWLQSSAKERNERSAAREAQTRADAQRREQEIRQGYQEQLQQARVTQDFIARMNDRYDATLNKVTEAFGENSAIIRQAKDEIRRGVDSTRENTEVIQENTEVLKRITGVKLPKQSAPKRITPEGTD
jgi:chromosome condensin MukBEF ATPase and DNA-binding subunit MukB